tara:strand:- start:124 stop:375 length:252 start_codon:yes stop_codon:yes gene_type:complete
MGLEIMSDKLNKQRKKLPKGTLIYTLEIAVNPEEGSVEYIVEGFDEVGEVKPGPMDSSWDYLEDYFDEEDFDVLDNLYDVGES